MRRVLTRLSIAFTLLALSLLLLSYWKQAGWTSQDNTWVQIPASGMQELHGTRRVGMLDRGAVMFTRSSSISAVVPIGSDASGYARRTASWFWRPYSPSRTRSWDDQWHLSRWDEWRLGRTGWYTTTGAGETSRVVSIPLWLVAVVVAIPAGVSSLAALRAARRRRRGRCIRCGYDRRGLIDQAPCPECGAAVR
ncbi:MAG: hypothetical protein AB7G11_11215 [Phycisphaerales bacterium]